MVMKRFVLNIILLNYNLQQMRLLYNFDERSLFMGCIGLLQKILGWGLKAEKNKYLNILEIFALQTGPIWLIIRSLKLIFRYKYQIVFIFSTLELCFVG